MARNRWQTRQSKFINLLRVLNVFACLVGKTKNVTEGVAFGLSRLNEWRSQHQINPMQALDVYAWESMGE